MKQLRGNWLLGLVAAAIAVLIVVPTLVLRHPGGTSTAPPGSTPIPVASVAVSRPTPSWTPTVTPAPATLPTATPTLPTQRYPGTLVITRISEPDHNYDIYLVRSDGTGFRRLTHASDNEEDAHWSPDGRRIFYGASDGSRVMNADGSGKTLMAFGGYLSPDGRRILYSFGDGSVWVRNADGDNRRCVIGFAGSANVGLIEEPVPPQYASWAPNGSIVFVRVLRSEGPSERYPGGDLLAVNPDGSGFVWLTRGADLILPSVSPDGRTIVAYAPQVDRIITLSWVAGAAPVTLLAHASDYFGNRGMPVARWTCDGKKLVLGSSNLGENGGSGLYLVNADGSGLTRIPHVKDAVCPDWRPQ